MPAIRRLLSVAGGLRRGGPLVDEMARTGEHGLDPLGTGIVTFPRAEPEAPMERRARQPGGQLVEIRASVTFSCPHRFNGRVG
jgi:hypothetical protein